MSLLRHRFNLTAITGFFAVVIFAAQGWLNSSFRNWRSDRLVVATSQSDSMSGRRWNPELFKAMSVGNLPSAIDWIWIQCLLDSSLEKVKQGQHLPVYYDLDLLTDLDPFFYEAYRAGANLLAVIHDDGTGARDLLLKGQKVLEQDLPRQSQEFKSRYWANSWGLPMLLAYVHLFELRDLPSAAAAYTEAASIPGAPPFLLKLKARLEEPDGQYQVGLHLVDFMLMAARNSKNPSEREIETLERQRESLLVGRFLFEANLEYQKTRKYPPQDPWGGQLSLDSSGRIVSSTPHEKVFGLD